MALPSTLYRFRVNLSDVDRDNYKDLDFRISMHPSETLPFLLTRVLAYALSDEEGLEFNPAGLSDSDSPALSAASQRGGLALWVEIGNPSARKLHKAAKAAERVKVFTYKDPDNLLSEIRANKVHRAEHIEIFSFASDFLEALGKHIARDNKWGLVHTEGSLTVNIGDFTIQGEITKHQA